MRTNLRLLAAMCEVMFPSFPSRDPVADLATVTCRTCGQRRRERSIDAFYCGEKDYRDEATEEYPTIPVEYEKGGRPPWCPWNGGTP